MEKNWLNPTVWATSITSFLSDVGHEIITTLLPSFLASLGAPAYALGLIEGISDGASSFAKLFSGYYSDITGKKKEIATLGYLATGFFPALVAIAVSWPLVLLARAIAWVGKGARGPPRDAILSNSVEEKDLGKAFGFQRTCDTLGAVVGPLLAYLLISFMALRGVFWFAVIPGTLAAVVFWIFVSEKKTAPPKKKNGIVVSIVGLPKRFKEFLYAVGIFGIADFSHTLLIFFVVTQLIPTMGFVQATATGVLLFCVRNIGYAIMSYPFGALGDKFGKRRVLALGYAIAVLTFIGFILANADPLQYGILFLLAGTFIAAEDTLEGAVAGQLVEKEKRALGYGALATVNGIGDFISSVIIGVLWATFGFSVGFLFSAIVASAGTLALLRMKDIHEH
ncbi:MAG: MFS transporter [Candidatus Bilamarchaeaceae archaeon]